ncbi:MAG: cysteine desulfurase family protein [Oscillospiraceae bacterium]
MHYLDYAATTPIPRAVADEMYRVLTEEFGNPSSQYPLGKRARELVADCRRTVAESLGCPPENLYFTSCGTESDNWAIHAALWQNRHMGKHIITTAVEHNAVLEPCLLLQQQGYDVTFLQPDGNGNITLQQIEDALRPDTALISLMLVNNETGNVFPVHEVAELLLRSRHRALLHTDGVQGFLKIPLSARELGADFISLSAHKIGGPKGVGALYISDRVKNPRPLLPGGGQEHGYRSGTEATAQLAGFAKAVALRSDHLADKLAHVAEMKDYATRQLLQIPDVQLVGDGTAPHILCVSLVGYPSSNVVEDLGAQGICLSAGSACHQGKLSHVVTALKLPKAVSAGVLRFSFAPETTREDIDAAVDALRAHHDNRYPLL